jgi:hypothetical protein
MKTASWVLLALVGALTLTAGLGSATLAYRGAEDKIMYGSVQMSDLAAGREDVAVALRGRRGTAASYAIGYATLFLFVVLGPYRRGEVWSWWALLVSSLALVLLMTLRVPLLGTRASADVAAIQFAVVIVALMLDVRRLKSSSQAR